MLGASDSLENRPQVSKNPSGNKIGWVKNRGIFVEIRKRSIRTNECSDYFLLLVAKAIQITLFSQKTKKAGISKTGARTRY
jgi:hypothetical protein